MSKILIICDVFTPNFLSNKLFDKDYICSFPGSAFWPIVHEFCLSQGWIAVTSDIFLSEELAYQDFQKYIISEMYTSVTDLLIAKGAIPLLIFSQESPNVALHFHRNLRNYTSKYKYAILFNGLKKFTHPSTVFHKLHWPNNLQNKIEDHISWSEKKLLVMVSSNKRQFDVALNRPFLHVRRILKKFYVTYVKAVNPLFRFEDLYVKRAKAILHFSRVKEFSLFGTLWEQANGLNPKYYAAAKLLSPTKVDNKYTTLAKYKFNLCFENCVFPGYVTEKIFDCLLAGTIPIYFGAPDISEFVPEDCYLNYADFESFSELQTTIEGMSEERGKAYLDAGKRFLKSDSFSKFTTQNFANLINRLLCQEILSQGKTSDRSENSYAKNKKRPY